VLPPQLELETHDGAGWVAVTPFEVRNLRPRPTLPLPMLSAFPEINVRTYVTFGGKPGIFFFSLDAGSALAVAATRRTYVAFWTLQRAAEADGARRSGAPDVGVLHA
jgi:uncharacterized protein